MDNRNMLNDSALEQAAGGFSPSCYDFNKGDKFIAEDGRYYYVRQDYSRAPLSDIILVVVEGPNDFYMKANVQVSCMIDRTYLGVDLEGLENALSKARY